MGKKSSPSPPPAPDPKETAAAQAAVNKETAIAQAQLNMVDQVGPYGSLRYERIGSDPVTTFDKAGYDAALSAYQSDLDRFNQQASNPTGRRNVYSQDWQKVAEQNKPQAPNPGDFYVTSGGSDTPRYRAITELTPEQQRILGLTNQASESYGQIANQQLSAVGDRLSQPLDFGGLGPAPQIDQEFRQQQLDSILNRLNPQLERDRAALETRLANQGISIGSEAYGSALDDYNRSLNDVRLAADLQAGNEAQRIYGLQADARDRAINEIIQQRTQPLNELAAMLSGTQVQNPSFVNTPQTGIQAPDLLGATYASYNGQLNAYNSAQQARSANTQGLYGLLGAGAQAAAYAWSDARLKTDIERVSQDSRGFGIYDFAYIWQPHVRYRGVMAQELLKVMPQAVAESKSGYLMVDYGMIGEFDG